MNFGYLIVCVVFSDFDVTRLAMAEKQSTQTDITLVKQHTVAEAVTLIKSEIEKLKLHSLKAEFAEKEILNIYIT